MLLLPTEQCTVVMVMCISCARAQACAGPEGFLSLLCSRCTVPMLHIIKMSSCLSCRGWKRACQQDLEDRPRWLLSCYGRDHQAVEIMGDTSPEEVRWADLREMRSGQAGGQQLESRWQAARAMKEKQFKVLFILPAPCWLPAAD